MHFSLINQPNMLKGISIFILFSFSAFTPEAAEEELLAVSLLYRHGDRTPTSFYPNDPYKDPSWWPVPFGELTNIGKLQHYVFGKWLRKRYDGFLSQIYNKSEIMVRSSATDRCIMSAASNLAGLYPPRGKDIWTEELLWQPIPIHTIPTEEDDIAEISASCPIFEDLLKESQEMPYFKDIDDSNKDLYELLTEKSGENITNFRDAGFMFDTLHIEKIYNLTIPEWALEVYPTLKKMHDIVPKLYTFTPTTARLFDGRLFNEILSQFNHFVANLSETSGPKNYQKFKVYSAHDDQVFSILNALKVENLQSAPYASAVIFELKRSQTGNIYVQVLYKTKENVADVVHIGGCELKCEFNEFVGIMKPFALTKDEFKKECS